MSDYYVAFPGTTGNYVSTTDVNLLDADTAHYYQSVGKWVARAEADTLTHETVSTATYGGKVLQFLAASPTGDTSVRVDGNTSTVSPSTQYSCVIRARTLGGVARAAYTYVAWYQGSTYKSQAASTLTALPADGSWVSIPVSGTSHGLADNAVPYLKVTDAVDNETFQVDRVCLRPGADSTFVPSLRIVGDIYHEADIALNDVTVGQDITGYVNAADNYYFGLYVDGSSLVRAMYRSVTNSVVFIAGFAHGLSNGERATLSVLRSPTTGVAVFKKDGVLLGSTSGVAEALAPNANTLHIGKAFAAADLDGDVFSVTTRDGNGGPVVARFDADDVKAVV